MKNSFYDKITLGISTYWEAGRAIRRQSDWQKIATVQNTRLRKLLHYAATHVKYYRELFETVGISTAEIRSGEDLVKIPILTKQELRSRFWDFLPRNLPACRVSRTSGSTGIPVCLLSDGNSRRSNSAAVIRCRYALGIPLIGRPILTPLKTETESPRRRHWTFLQGIHRTYYINPYSSVAADIDTARSILASLRKPALVGITPAIKKLAYCIRDSVLPAVTPSVVLTTGEVLTEQTRELLESTFRAKVADIYACNEAGDVGWQCLEGNYHVNADNVIVEILRGGYPVEPGQVGEVVITNVNRYAMPIIRYANGDLARFATNPCPCGCRLPLLAEIIGRSGQDILLPTGKQMPWNQLKGLMNHPHIRQFQLVQNHDGTLLIKYVAEPGTEGRTLDELIRKRYANLLGDSLPISVTRVEQIPPAASGKSQLVVSHYDKRRDVRLPLT